MKNHEHFHFCWRRATESCWQLFSDNLFNRLILQPAHFWSWTANQLREISWNKKFEAESQGEMKLRYFLNVVHELCSFIFDFSYRHWNSRTTKRNAWNHVMTRNFPLPPLTVTALKMKLIKRVWARKMVSPSIALSRGRLHLKRELCEWYEKLNQFELCKWIGKKLSESLF